MAKLYKVPFEEKESVWSEYHATVRANSLEEAKSIVVNHCENGVIHDCVGVAGVESVEFHSTFMHLDGGEFENELTVNAVEIVDKPSVEVSFSAFDLLRLEKDAVYNAMQEKLALVGIHDEVSEMTMRPIRFNEEYVVYDCQVVKFGEVS